MNNFSKRLAGLSLGLLLTLGVGVAGGQHDVVGVKAADATTNSVIATLSFPDENKDNNKVSSYYNSPWVAIQTTDGSKYEWDVVNFNNNKWNNWTYIGCGQEGYNSTATISNSTIFNGKITSVVVTITSVGTASVVTSFTLECSEDKDFTSPTSVKIDSVSTGDKTFNVPSDDKNYQYFQIKVVQTKKTNGNVKIGKLVYNGTPSTNPIINITGAPTDALDITGQAVTTPLSYAVKNATNPVVEWSSSDEDIVSIDKNTGVYTAVGGGEAVITASMTCDESTEKITSIVSINVNFNKAITVDEAYALAESLEVAKTSVYKVIVTGTISRLVTKEGKSNQTQYNVYFATSAGKELHAYFGYLDSLDGFDSWIAEGTKLTLKGNLDHRSADYIQFKNLTVVSYSNDAVVFASYFVSTLTAKGGACADTEKDNTEALKTAWTDLKAKWSAVDSTSKGDLKDATAEDANYGEFVKLYDHIMKRYGEDKLGTGANFVGRTVSTTTSGAHAVLASADNSLTITIIVLVSVLSVSLIVGTSLIVRKRKAN